MAKSKGGAVADMVGKGAAFVTEAMVSGIFSKLREEIEGVMRGIEERTLALQERIARRIFGSLIMLLGFVFLVVAALLGLVEYARLSWAAAFFACGLLLILLWWYLRNDRAKTTPVS